MVDINKICDGIVFKDNECPGETITFNLYSWVEIIKAIMVKYAGKSKKESEDLFFYSFLFKNLSLNPNKDITFYSHEIEYHWAMLIVHGEMYWLKGISSLEPDGYFEWEAQYRKENNLAAESFEFSH